MTIKVKKAVIPAAGLGTRFLPATKAMPKEMLPIVDKPTIQYIVEEAVAAGIEEIVIITGRSKRAIEDHFDKNLELEFNLLEKNKEDLLKMVQGITHLANIHYVRQKEALGLGHAILCARPFIKNEPFAVLLGDMVSESSIPCLREMVNRYEERETSMIAVKPVAWEKVSQYGVVDGIQIDERIAQVRRLVEKPKQNPPSNLAIMGRYILDTKIMEILAHTPRGVGNEIQLTDALQVFVEQEPLLSYLYEGTIYDVGSKWGFLQANIEFALKDEELCEQFTCYIQKIKNIKDTTEKDLLQSV